VSSHWREVVGVARLRVLTHDHWTVAEIRVQAGDRRGALRCAVLSQLIWPLSPRLTLRLSHGIARMGTDKERATPSAGDA